MGNVEALTRDAALRRRLARRYGPAIDAWLDALPSELGALARRWGIEPVSLIQRGSMSVVLRCRRDDGSAAVLKVTPDRTRIEHEARGLASWKTRHVPKLLAADVAAGALLLEAIEPEAPLSETGVFPSQARIVDLVGGLHGGAVPDPSFPRLEDRISHLYDASVRQYERTPELAAIVPPALLERGRRLSLRLAADARGSVLLHADLTPRNILDSGERGLVAVDPAPCIGDATYDLIDLAYWQADDPDTLGERARQLAPPLGADPARLFDWCTVFAAMAALELIEDAGPPYEENAFVALARDA